MPFAPCLMNHHIHHCQVKFQQYFCPKTRKDMSVDTVILFHTPSLNVSDNTALFFFFMLRISDDISILLSSEYTAPTSN